MKIANDRGSVITKLGIGCVVCLLLGFGILLYAQEKTELKFIGTKPEMDAVKIKEKKETNTAKMQAMAQAKEQPEPQRNNRSWGRQNREERVDFGENAAFYKTIIDHNLFRPLGWTPPNNEPSYSLIGTAVDENGAISQATLLEKRSNRYHFVTIGTKVGDMTVKDIQGKKVTFDKAGETVTLRTGEFQPLTVKRERSDRGGDRGERGSERANNNNERDRGNQAAAEKRRQMEQKRQSAAQREQLRRDIMEKMRHASSDAERKEIMEYYKKEFGGKSGRDK